MKNTLFYLIIAAIVIYVIYRIRKPAAKPTATTTTETPSNSGLFVSPSGGGSDTGTVDPGEPQANDEIIVKTETGDCPYCGTHNAEITRYIKNGKVIKMSVMCGNKSCPGGYGKVKKAEIIANDSKFVKPQTGR